MPDRGKQPLHFPGSFLGTGVRYFSKVEVAPPVAASCLASPRNGQSSSKAALCHTEQREQGIAVGSPCILLALEELCSGILQASKPSQRSLGGSFQCQGRTHRRLCPAMASLDQKCSLNEHRVVTCWAWLGCLPAEFTTDPSTGQQGSVCPGPRHLFSRCWVCLVIPQSLPGFLRSCSNLLVALTTVAAL